MAANGDTVTGQGCCARHRAHGARSRLRPLTAILLLAALLCPLPQATAASSVDITAVVGFTDTFHPGHWTPLSVTVANRGGDLSAELEVQVAGGDELRGRPFVASHRRKLEIHRGSRKTLQFTVLPQSLSQPLVIRVHAGGRELARSEVDLRTRFIAYERLLLVLSRDANLDHLNDRADNGVRVLYPHPELLPAHWRGYDAVGAVVAHGTSLERLSASQFDALRKWIAQGGVLAVSGGPEYGLLRTPRLASLLPGAPVGMTRMDPGALQEAFPSLNLSRPVHVHRLGPVLGHVRVHAGDMPLIVERTLGHGRVLYLTFDVAADPFDRWAGMREVWLDNLRIPPPPATSLRFADSGPEGPLLALIRAKPADLPSYVAVLLFLMLYLGLLLALYQLPFATARLRPLGTLRIWGASASFALAAWLLFGPAAFPRGASAISIALIEPFPDDRYARLEIDLGVYANRSGAPRLEYRGAEPMLYPRQAQRGAGVGDWVFGEGPRPYLEPQDRRRYVLHALQGEDVIAFDLHASVYDEAPGPRLVLDNRSGRALNNLQLAFDGYAYDLGSIAAGAKVERRLSRGAHGFAVSNASWRDLLRLPRGIDPQALEPVQIVLERRSKTTGESWNPGAGRALLLGYTDSPLRPAGASADWPRREQAVVAMRVAVSPMKAPANETGEVPRERRGRQFEHSAWPRMWSAAAHASAAMRDE